MSKKYQEIYKLLRQDIQSHEFQNGDKLPSETEMMEKYSVSRQTVRHALSFLMADGLIRKAQGSGSFVHYACATLNTKRIAVLFYDVNNYIFSAMMREIDTAVYERGYMASFYSTIGSAEKERSILRQLIATPVDGIVFHASAEHLVCGNMDLFAQLQKMGTKIIFFSNRYMNPELLQIPLIGSEDYVGAEKITGFLLRQGHKRIGCFRIFGSLLIDTRFAGVCNALLRCGMPLDEKNYIPVYGRYNQMQIMNDAAAECLSYADAFICLSASLFDLLLECFRKYGHGNIRTVVVFDKVKVPEIKGVEFIVLQYDLCKAALLCAEGILAQIEGEMISSQQLPWLITEDSTAETLPTDFEREAAQRE